MRELLESMSPAHWLMAAGAGLALAVIVLIWWMIAGVGPRRRRALRHARRLVSDGQWADVLARMSEWRAIGRPDDASRLAFDQVEGQALKAGASERLAAKDYETALNYGSHAARLLEENPLEPRMQVQNALLEDARRLFATSPDDPAAILDLLHRAIRVQSPCREASFWQAMCLLRAGDVEQAIEHLHIARTGMERSFREDDVPDERYGPTSPILEPPLYLGAILLEQGKAKDALRYITEANRLDSSCPLVTLLLGNGMVAAGGDASLAVRTLQRAISRIESWIGRPTAFWAEVYPENRSYVRKLAVNYPFVCPLWGNGPADLLRRGRLALAQGLQRLGQDQDAAVLFNQVLDAGPPSEPMLRGHGIALARLGRFDDAARSLRLALDLEDPKDRLTSGYLALCVTRLTPASENDRTNNMVWSVSAVTPFSAPGDAEWVGLANSVFAAARAAGVPLSLDDQLYLCEHLASVDAIDENAAAAFAQIFAQHPAMVRPEYAWLYGQAMVTSGRLESASLPLLSLAVHARDAAQPFFESRGWSFEAIERAYLLVAARLQPGRLPEAFGDAALARAEELLLGGSRRAEDDGDLDEARALVDAFSRLVPHHPGALDRLAALHHRAGRHAQAVAALYHWQQRYPRDPLPLVRLALVRAGADEIVESLDLLAMARDLAQGTARSRIGLIAGRLALHDWGRERTEGTAASLSPTDALARAEDFLNRAAMDDSSRDHATSDEAIALLAAVRWLRSDEAGLASLAERCRGINSGDPLFHYFSALALLAARDWTGVSTACRTVTRLVADANGSLGALAIEAAYLEGVAQAELGETTAAVEALEKPAASESSPSSPFARGLLGAMLFRRGEFDAASVWWQKLSAPQRSAWNLTEIMGGTQLLAALDAFHAGQFEVAADRFRLAGRLGCRDRRLGAMLLASLVKAGQQAVYGTVDAPADAPSTRMN